jgi:hypothetical protein
VVRPDAVLEPELQRAVVQRACWALRIDAAPKDVGQEPGQARRTTDISFLVIVFSPRNACFSRIGPYRNHANVSCFAHLTLSLSTLPEGIAQFGSLELDIIDAYLVGTTINLTDIARQGTLSRYATRAHWCTDHLGMSRP